MSASTCQMSTTVIGLALMLAGHQLAEASNLGRARVSPELDPVSDKDHFGPPFPADYPSDQGRGSVKHAFNYPFPHVQSSSTFDSDYVKDENSDNGEWNAQMEYDSLRAQLAKAKREAEEAKKKLAEETGEADKAKDAYGDAKKDEEAAKDAADEAADKAKEAAAKEEAAKKAAEEAGKYSGDVPLENRIEEAKKKVEEKIKNLDDCKKQLKDAQDALKALLEEAEKKREEEAAEHAEEQQEAAGKVAEAQKTADAAATGETDAQQAYLSADKKADALKAKWEEEKAEEDKAEQSYEKEQQDVAELEKKLKAAEDRLRAIRGGGSLPAKGDSHSDASATTLSLSVLALVALMVH